MCGNCESSICDCPTGQSITHCACSKPHYIYCDACGHGPVLTAKSAADEPGQEQA